MKRQKFQHQTGPGTAGLLEVSCMGPEKLPNVLFISIDDVNDRIPRMGGKRWIHTLLTKFIIMQPSHIILLTVLTLFLISSCQKNDDSLKNLALVAQASSSTSEDELTSSEIWVRSAILGSMTFWSDQLNDGLTLARQVNIRLGEPQRQWVQYEWQHPVATEKMAVFLWDYNEEVPLPDNYLVSYWDGNNFVDLKNVSRQDMGNDRFDTIYFSEIQTTKIRIEAESGLMFPANILEWEVYQLLGSQDHPPVVSAGPDRDVMINGRTYVSGAYKSVTPSDKIVWSKESGEGDVSFEDPNSLEGTAEFSKPGDYVLKLSVRDGNMEGSSTLKITAHQPPPGEHLEKVYTSPYQIDNPLWNDRLKATLVNWIPHLIDKINDSDLETGGINNFTEAAKALRDESHDNHRGFSFSNAWVYQTVESMSFALMYDAQGDREIIAAQEKMAETLENWIPEILAAQEPDGYIQTAYTLRDTTKWKERWEPANRSVHEGYTAGYFIDAALAHYKLTEGRDRRLYDAAVKLADCWADNLGPGKKSWYDGHQGIKQSLISLARFIRDKEEAGRSDDYIILAKFLADNRGDGIEHYQTHQPVHKQYEAVGHAVRVPFLSNGMAGIASETGNVDYHSAVKSVWNNLVNKKYYITGGIGSGETSEGFGPDYSLPNNSYCEACASCGLIVFQHSMNSIYHDAKYADLYEETLYNALLGSLDLEGKNFFYPNPLITEQPRYPWHYCPCCVGNIPRTLLMMPSWTYQKDNTGIYVNLFIGSTMDVENVAGTDVEIIQETDYPWNGYVSITINPDVTKELTFYVRIPDRNTSELYGAVPEVNGYNSLKVNGESIRPEIKNGYAVITRIWEKGDRIDLELPMEIQRVTADERVEANRGKVALRYGPLVYNVERTDNQDVGKVISDIPLSAEWHEDFLNGVVVIKGEWMDGSTLTAIPNYARGNRIDETKEESVNSIVWINRLLPE
jgi:uncharacterized protein